MQKLTLTSPAFKERETIPTKYTCDGENVNPPLEWHGVPDETRSLVLIMDDPDVPRYIREDGQWTHWLLWNIPPDVAGIEENNIPTNAKVGTNTAGVNNYGGPCPPNGEHRYFFKLYALDTELALPTDTGKEELMEALVGHIIDDTELLGVYER